jgi:hypothetical protein
MQIHEITHLTKQQLDEGVADTIGAGAGKAVSGVKRVGSAVTAPFKNVAMGYQTGRADQRTAAVADKFQRAWQQYAQQWAKSNGGQITAPGSAAPQSGQQQPGTMGSGPAGQTPVGQVTAQSLYPVIQSLDNKKLNAIAKILSQRVGPQATMNALKKPEPNVLPISESQLNELGWQDIKAGAQKFGSGVASAYKAAKPMVKKAVNTGVNAVKAAPGAIATGAGATAGAIAGMPARANTAYRAGKSFTAGTGMTMQELQNALFSIKPAEAKKLLDYIQQILTARKAGIREGIATATLVPDYTNALKAWIQKNMLAGMQYSRLQNASQIDQLIASIADPANDNAATQKDLWNKLTLAASVAQHNPAGQANTQQQANTQPSTQQQTGNGETAEELKLPVAQALGTVSGLDKSAATIGGIIRKNYTNNAVDIGSTGVPAVDAMLINMGFKPA